MALTSISFILFVFVFFLLTAMTPAKHRWAILVLANFFFVYQVGGVVSFLIWFCTALFTYAAALYFAKNKNKYFMGIAIVVITTMMIASKQGVTGIIFPIGISYYSLIWIGYLLDIYWGIGECEKNIGRFFAFAGFFPILTSGPIIKYQDVSSYIKGNVKLTYKNISFGTQRILWGFAKKLIIADRIAVVVNTIYSDTMVYAGTYVWIAFIMFVLQLYFDFSGCIDIVIGTAELIGINLPENFKFPFLSTSVEVFWRNWHITLGAWLRNYIFYPLLKSSPFQLLTKKCKKIFGKKYGKKIPTWIALMITWTLIGLWHGTSFNYVFGVGIFFGTIIVISDACTPLYNRIKSVLHINDKVFSYRLFQYIRTFIFFAVGNSFFRAYGGFREGLTNWKNGFMYNPWVLVDGSMFDLGLDRIDFSILFVAIAIMALVGIIEFKKQISMREMIASQNLIFRWGMYMILLYSIIIFGYYGVEFSSSAFIYQNF